MAGEVKRKTLEELEALAAAHSADVNTLEALLIDMSGRSDDGARNLRGRILTRIGQLSRESVPDGTLTITREAAASTLDAGLQWISPIRPPGTPGLPSPRKKIVKRGIELNVAHDADLPERYLVALEALINDRREAKDRKYCPLRNGTFQSREGPDCVYVFALPDEHRARPPDDAKVDIDIGKERVSGRVLSYSNGVLIVALPKDFGATIPKARLIIDDAALYQLLCAKLRDSMQGSFEFNRALADAAVGARNMPAVTPIRFRHAATTLNASQDRARRRILRQSVTFVWGPPGCGKTFTMSDVVHTVLRAGKRVLVCSNTNKAVDQLLLGICNAVGPDSPGLRAGRIVRLGDVVDDKLRAQFGSAVHLDAIVARIESAIDDEMSVLKNRMTELDGEIHTWQDVIERREDLENREGDWSRELAGLAPHEACHRAIEHARERHVALDSEIRALREKQARVRSQVIREARVLAMTGWSAYRSVPDIGSFELVIVDEASMLLLPITWFVAGLSTERVVLCGDFRQIAPILPTEQAAIVEVIGHDVFRAARVDALTPGDQRIEMLDTQRRMDDAICSLISGPMYAGLLITAQDAAFLAEQRSRPAAPAPFDGPLTLVDTSALGPLEDFDVTSSRFNMMHALLVRNTARLLKSANLTEDPRSLAICTPYAAQSRLIHQLLTDEGLSQVQVGTVHALQGDERNIVIVDIPESANGTTERKRTGKSGGSPLGRLVDGLAPDDDSARLINVAVSRAQNHLIVIANVRHLDERLPSKALLRAVLAGMQQRGRVIPAADLLQFGPLDRDLKGLDARRIDSCGQHIGLFDQRTFDGALAADIGRATQSIAIFSGFITLKRIREYDTLLGEAIHDSVRIRCVTKPPHLRSADGVFESDDRAALDRLEALGCVVDCRANIHQKVVIIDRQIIWHGSLNPLSFAQKTEEFMMRQVSPGLAQLVAKLLARRPVRFVDVLDKITEPENPRCKKCRGRTFLTGLRARQEFRCEGLCGWAKSMADYASEYEEQALSSVSFEDLPSHGPPCPLCGGSTVKKKGQFGPFYPCTRFAETHCKGRFTLRDLQIEFDD